MVRARRVDPTPIASTIAATGYPARRAVALLSAGLLSAGLLFNGSALAQEVSPSDRAAEHFEQGNTLFDSGDVAAAEQSYRKAWELNPRFDYAANLGAAQFELGKWVDAAHNLAYAVTHIPGDLSPERRDALSARFEEVRSKVGSVRLRSQPRASSVTLDGAEPRVSAWQDWVFVEPGTHVVVATWEQGPQDRRIEVAAGQELDLVLSPNDPSTPVEKPPSPIQPPAQTRDEGAPAWPIVAGATTTAALAGVGVVFVIVGSGQQSDADDRRDELASEGRRCEGGCEELVSLYEDADASFNTAVPLFIGAGIVGLSTVAYAVFAPTASEGVTAASVSVGPTNISISGRF